MAGYEKRLAGAAVDRQSILASLLDRGEIEAVYRSVGRDQLADAIRNHVVGRMTGGATPAQSQSEPLSFEGTIYFKRFLAALLEPDPGDYHRVLERLEVEDPPVMAICQTLVLPVSAELGRLWRDDSSSFVAISIAANRLQTMVDQLSMRKSPRARPSEAQRVLLARLPGENHTLGLSVIAACFRDEGWEVEGGPDLEADDDCLRLLRRDRFSLFGLSVGCDAALGDVRDTVGEAIKACSKSNTRIGIGGPAAAERANEFMEMGASFAINDLRQVLAVARSFPA